MTANTTLAATGAAGTDKGQAKTLRMAMTLIAGFFEHEAMPLNVTNLMRDLEALATVLPSPATGGELREAAKAFYNATVADTQVRISSDSEEKRDVAAAAANRLRDALVATRDVAGGELDVEAERLSPIEEKLDAAWKWIADVPHGENCFLHDEGEFDKCFCGKDALLAFIESEDSCRAATGTPAKSAPGEAERRIPRESNDKLIEFARHWKLDGDWMTCKGCKRSLIASRDGEALNHASGCKLAAQQHPWARLRSLIEPVAPSNSPVGAKEQDK